MTQDPEPRWITSSQVRSTINGDGGILLDVERGLFFSVNLIGAKIWEKIQNYQAGVSLSTLVDALAPELEIGRSQLRSDIEAFAEVLEKQRLIRHLNGNRSA